MKLTMLTRFDDLGASSRMRALQYLPFFREAGIEVDVLPLFSNSDLARRYQQGSYGLGKIVSRYFQRSMALTGRSSDLVWIEKEMIPWAPAWFESVLLRGRKYVMDFDDAIFHNYDAHRISALRALYGKKIDRLMRRANLVIAGNDYLADRARSAGCGRVEIIPTVIDLRRYPVKSDEKNVSQRNHAAADGAVVIGWIGSPYTTKYLELLKNPLARLSEQENIRLRVIGGRTVEFPGVQIESLEWQEAEEANMLSECDIGVMPLPDSPWERGKCGYKLIQYMACGKPVVGSPIGVNSKIVQPENGFLCQSESEWHDSLLKLCRDPELRIRMGQRGRADVEQKFCIQQTAPQVIRLLQDA